MRKTRLALVPLVTLATCLPLLVVPAVAADGPAHRRSGSFSDPRGDVEDQSRDLIGIELLTDPTIDRFAGKVTMVAAPTAASSFDIVIGYGYVNADATRCVDLGVSQTIRVENGRVTSGDRLSGSSYSFDDRFPGAKGARYECALVLDTTSTDPDNQEIYDQGDYAFVLDAQAPPSLVITAARQVVKPGVAKTVKVRVTNNGQDIARSVRGTFSGGSGLRLSKRSFTVPPLDQGQSAVVSVKVRLDRRQIKGLVIRVGADLARPVSRTIAVDATR